MRAVDEDQPGSAVMRRPIESRGISAQLYDAVGIAAPGAAAVTQPRAARRLVDIAPLGRLDRQRGWLIGWQIERSDRNARRRIDREIERGAAVEGADLDDFAARRRIPRRQSQHGELGQADIAIAFGGLSQLDRTAF